MTSRSAPTTTAAALVVQEGLQSAQGQKYDRQVFLRPSILSATAGRDIEILGHSAPVLLALRSNSDPLAEESATRRIANAPDVLEYREDGSVAPVLERVAPAGPFES
jgi:hypothetical protein